MPQTVKLAPGQLDLYHHYVRSDGGKRQAVRQGEYTVVDADGGVRQGTLDANGFASVSGLPMGMASIIYGKDPRDPWDEASYFGEETEWPSRPLAVPVTLKVDTIAQTARQAIGAAQALRRGGAQALLGPAGQAALANGGGKLDVPPAILKKSIV